MEFEIKNLDFETLIKLLDDFVDIHQKLYNRIDGIYFRLGEVSRSLQTIAEEMVAGNEALKI